MGTIKPDVDVHLRVHPDDRALLKPFLFNFHVNHARRININGAQCSAFILSPDDFMRTSFAFQDELLLVIHSFNVIQPRVIQAIEKTYEMEPFKSRADPLTYFLLSKDVNVDEWVSNYLMSHPQARTPIALSFDAIRANKDDRWFIRNQLSSQLYKRDLFDYQLPLDEDVLFFGRKSLVDDFIDAMRKGQNRGLFGLRKTGKTSLLFKLQRDAKQLNIARTIYFDCKRPDLRSLNWTDLLEVVSVAISDVTGKKFTRKKDTMKNFMRVISSLSDSERICVIFDEIEYISPLSYLDRHWKADFIPFWQTLWSIQSQFRRISFIIAGVNPYLCEIDLINKTQNPMFGIVRPQFLTGLSVDEVAQMVKAIGGRMGLGFESSAIAYIYARYGGHPLLTRMACSHTNQAAIRQESTRPIAISRQRVIDEQTERENELHFYCKHVISELQDFYPSEFEMLELLSAGNIVDFNDLAGEPGWIRHLKSYGIIDVAPTGRPTFRIPVIQRFVATERARRERTGDLRAIIRPEARNSWLAARSANILHDLKSLLRLMEAKKQWQPYGQSFLPEADLIGNSKVASDWQAFNSFITDLNKCLVESIDIVHGKSAFYNHFKEHYGDLFDALNRIRLLRNNADHLRLNSRVEDGLRTYIERDLMGRTLTQVKEPWFVLQQVTLDELFSAIQYETARIS